MPYIYVGKETADVGHKLWTILKNLPRNGAGRYVVRNALFSKYREPSLVRIKRVETHLDDLGISVIGRIFVESWFRGIHTDNHEIQNDHNRSDWSLIPIDEEQKYMDAVLNFKPPPEVVLPPTVAVPPLLKLHLEQRHRLYVPRVPLKVNLEKTFFTRQAATEEEATVSSQEVDGVGSTPHTHFYKNVNFQEATHKPDRKSDAQGHVISPIKFGHEEDEALDQKKHPFRRLKIDLYDFDSFDKRTF